MLEARNIIYGIFTIYTNGLISGYPEIGALVPIIFYNLIVRIRHPALHGAIYLHQKTGFARHLKTIGAVRSLFSALAAPDQGAVGETWLFYTASKKSLYLML